MNEQSIQYPQEVKKIYGILDQSISNAGGLKSLNCSYCRGHLPKQGVEFYFRDGDYRKGSNDRLRVVHVGVSKRARERVADHLNLSQLNSIFRDHLTIAIAGKQEKIPNANSNNCSKIAKSIISTHPEIKECVYKELKMHHIFCLPVDEEKDRNEIKKNAIALLSWYANETAIFPQNTWLGNYHHDTKIQSSGLWNIEFLHGTYCPDFLQLMKKCGEGVVDDL